LIRNNFFNGDDGQLRRRPNEQWPTRLPLQQHRERSILLVRSRKAWPIPRSSKRGSSRRNRRTGIF